MISEEKIRIEVNCEKNRTIQFICSLNGKAQENGITLDITETTIDNCKLGSLTLTTKKTIFDNNVNLLDENSVRVFLPLKETPEKITAMYMLNDWLIKPAFIEKMQRYSTSNTNCIFQISKQSCLFCSNDWS